MKINKLLMKGMILPSLLFSNFVFAEYMVKVPLEVSGGGQLPNHSIIIGSGSGSQTPDTPSTNCIYTANSSYVYVMGPDGEESPSGDFFVQGDQVFFYNGSVIGYSSPSNGYSKPNGLNAGTQKATSFVGGKIMEICANDLDIYPPVGPSGPPPPPPPPPVDDHTGPDWTPECILNTSTDYAAINNSNGTREFYSTSFGLAKFSPSSWTYVPSDYESNPSAYIYFDNAEKTGNPRVSGPNPNYTYSEICRVKKMEL